MRTPLNSQRTCSTFTSMNKSVGSERSVNWKVRYWSAGQMSSTRRRWVDLVNFWCASGNFVINYYFLENFINTFLAISRPQTVIYRYFTFPKLPFSKGQMLSLQHNMSVRCALIVGQVDAFRLRFFELNVWKQWKWLQTGYSSVKCSL